MSKKSNIHIEFDKEFFEFGTDTIISGTIFGVEEESVEVFLLTKYGIEKSSYVNFRDDPEEYDEMESEPYMAKNTDGYHFEFPLKFPNIDAGQDTFALDTFTYVCNFISFDDIEMAVPISFPELGESREEAKKIIDERIGNLSEGVERQEIIAASTEIREFFKKRTLESNFEPGMIRLPWNLGDSVNEQYYNSIKNSSPLFIVAHGAYLYNLHYFLYFIVLCYSVFFAFHLEMTVFDPDPLYSFIEIGLVLGAAALSYVQYRFKKQVSPSEYYLQLKDREQIEKIFSGGSFTLGDIFAEPINGVNNPLTDASGSIEFYLQSYYSYSYKVGKSTFYHVERLSLKRLVSISFTSHSKILAHPFEIDGDNPFIKLRENLEEVGIFLGFDLTIQYAQFPDKDYEYNLDRIA